MKVEDIMTKDVISVSPDTKLIEVAELLQNKKFNGVPVVRNRKVLGMITESDLLSRGSSSFHIPSLIKIFYEFQLEKYISKEKEKNFQPIFNATADLVMNQDYIFVFPNDEITKLIKIFQEKHVNPIPVVDEEKNLKGIVSLHDIINLISRFREAEIDFISAAND